jgi:hydrogenase maturation protease
MTLVIAYGNPLRQDDGVGWAVAEALAGHPGVRLETVHQLLPELAEPLSRAHFAVFVDARRGGPAGEVRRTTVVAASDGWSSAHSLGPEQLLGLCERCFGHAPKAVLVSVAGARFDFGADLSPEVALAIPNAVSCVLAEHPSHAGGRP